MIDFNQFDKINMSSTYLIYLLSKTSNHSIFNMMMENIRSFHLKNIYVHNNMINLPRYLLILDFEANCEESKIPFPQEIIEFPIIAYDRLLKKQVGMFHKYCNALRPISEFCTNLTGISQEMVDNGDDFYSVLKKVDIWMNENNFVDNSVFVTYGRWDLETCLPKYCKYLNIKPNGYFSNWINIKDMFTDKYKQKPKDMMNALSLLNIKHIGRHHSGIDDCKNILEILIKILE